MSSSKPVSTSFSNAKSVLMSFSKQALIMEVEKLHQKLNELQEEKTALEVLLEINNKCTDAIEENLLWEQEEKKALEICLEMSNEHTDAVEEQLVRENDRKIASFMEAVPVGVLVLNAKGKISFCNRKALQLLFGEEGTIEEGQLQVTTKQLLNMYPLYVAGTEQIYPFTNLPTRRALRGESTRVEDIEIHQPDGNIPIEAWGVPIRNKQGRVTHAITVFQDITERRQAEIQKEQFTNQLKALNASLEDKVAERTVQLEQKNELIRQVFGRYLSDEIVETLLETECGLVLGGERREITLLTSDIRGFTAQTDNLPPEQVIKIINFYLTAMADVITEYQGTIDEFMGDGILVLFGAPIVRDDDPQRAVACAVAMQLAMNKVNEKIIAWGYAPLEMGIGVNTAEVVVGNIGSEKRTKYGIIGGEVNLTYRIESYTTGGQIFISKSTFNKLGDLVKIRTTQEVKPKGVKQPITIYEVAGIGGKYNRYLEKSEEFFVPLTTTVPLHYTVLEGKHISNQSWSGQLLKLSVKGALIQCDETVIPESFANLKINLILPNTSITAEDVYAKVVNKRDKNTLHLHFTAIPVNIKTQLLVLFKSEWSPDLSINHAIIDEQHQQLFIIFKNLITSIDCQQQQANVAEVIDFLEAYVTSHFENEEHLMKQYDYPYYTLHQAQHVKFMENVKELKREYQQNRQEYFYLAFQIYHQLVDWFIHHIARFDKQLGQFLQKKTSPVISA
jgi:hemerythrin-like metal-binding protein